MDIARYLDRIQAQAPYAADIETLRRLQTAHMMTVPFENLNILLKRPIILDEEALYHKIVTCRRGGFCYELNGLFSAMLRSMGFKVDRVSARVWTGEAYSQDFDHMALIVHLDEDWLVDVGFGDSFIEPLRLVADQAQTVANGTFRLVQQDDRWILESSKANGWTPEYSFSTRAYDMADFEPMCLWQQTAEKSGFNKRRICSRATADGRVTLSEHKIILTRSRQREELPLSDEAAVIAALKDHFAIDLSLT
jgi:N-hydroxyarylamine O-acetyltransferase